MTFDAANQWLQSRVNVLIKMNSAELSLSKNFPPKVRAHCFFSAKVTEANLLDGLRKEVDKFAQGKNNLATARMNLKTFLSRNGCAPDDVSKQDKPPAGVSEKEWKRRKSISNLASTRRLNLILSQNSRMASAVGAREASMSPGIRERWPYFRYMAMSDARDSHGELDNLVLKKDDPFWDTHTPPWDFNCRCSIEDCDADEAEEFGGIDKSFTTENPDGSQDARITVNGRDLNIGPNKSGYVFDVREAFETCDMARIKGIPMRKAVFAKLAEYARKNDGCRFLCQPGKAASTFVPVSGDAAAMTGFIEKQAANFTEKGSFLKGDIAIGKFSKGLNEALGIEGEGEVFLGKGTTGHGFVHMSKRHLEEIKDGDFSKALKETLFTSKVRTTVVLAGKKVICSIHNMKTGAFTTLVRREGNWNNWNIVSAHYPGIKHAVDKEIMRK